MKIKPIVASSVLIMATSLSNITLAQEKMVLEEVIVTAQKRQESLQSIPLSISAFNGDEIRDMGAIDFRGLSTRLANVNVSNDQNSIDIAIRGVSNNRGFAPATAFHIDGIYTGQSQSGLTAFLDVQRVEVLRGPQGTLYGRNATAGAINVITNRPNTEELSGSIEMTAGNYDLLNVQAVGNVPIIEDQLALRVALLSEDRDGYTEHDGMGFSQDPSDDSELTGGKIRLLYQPTETVEWLVGYDFSEQKGAGPRFYTDLDHLIPVEDLLEAAGDNAVAKILIPILQPGRAFENLPPDQQRKITDDPRYVPVFYNNETDPETIALNNMQQDSEQKTLMTELKVALGEVDLTFLGGYRELDSVRSGDNDFWAGSRTSSSNIDAKEQSYELRLSQDLETVQWLLGLYYYNNDNDSYFDAGSAVGFGSDSTSTAIFSQATWSLSDTLALTGGLRYSEDDSDSSDLLNPELPTESVGFDDVSWKLSLEKSFAEDSMVYATISTGYKTGGLNSGSQLNPIYDEETVIAYEVGSKNRLMGGRLQLNAAMFYYDYSDLQVSGIEVIPQLDENGEPIPDPDNPDAFLIESVNTSNSNIDSSEMYGAEVEWVALLSESFQFDGALGLLRTEIDEGVVDNGAVFGASPTIVSGNEMRKAPGMSLNLGLQYDADVPAIAGSITARLDFHYEEEQYHDVINRPQDLTDSFTKTDISVTYRTENARYFVQLFGRNLEDEDVRTTIFQSAAGPLVAFAPPRTYGVRAGVDF
jgi:iron complex outermembrane recepter protein